jgi:hypothetical protein
VINFEEEIKRIFERDFTYLHLCTFLEPQWGIRIAKSLITRGNKMFLDEKLAMDPVTGL